MSFARGCPSRSSLRSGATGPLGFWGGSCCTLRVLGVSVSAGPRGATVYSNQFRTVLDANPSHRAAFLSFVVRSGGVDGGKEARGDDSHRGLVRSPSRQQFASRGYLSLLPTFPSLLPPCRGPPAQRRRVPHLGRCIHSPSPKAEGLRSVFCVSCLAIFKFECVPLCQSEVQPRIRSPGFHLLGNKVAGPARRAEVEFRVRI